MIHRCSLLLLTITLALATISLSIVPTFAEKSPTTFPDNHSIDAFSYRYAPAMFGASAFFTLNKDGKVHYTYSSGADTDDGGQRVNKEWDIPPEEAANFL